MRRETVGVGITLSPRDGQAISLQRLVLFAVIYELELSKMSRQ